MLIKRVNGRLAEGGGVSDVRESYSEGGGSIHLVPRSSQPGSLVIAGCYVMLRGPDRGLVHVTVIHHKGVSSASLPPYLIPFSVYLCYLRKKCLRQEVHTR